MKIAIIGCGWVGARLASYLQEKNHYLIVTTTSLDKFPDLQKVASEVHILDFTETKSFDYLDGVDIAIFSMPVSRSHWFEGFKNLNKVFPKTLFFSSTGIYPTKPQIFTELDTDDLRTDILTAENVVREEYPQTTILRFGGLMGDERSLQNIFKNKMPENPLKKSNYIHYEDILAVVEKLIQSDKKSQIYNLVAPEHPTIAEILNLENKNSDRNTTLENQRIISSEGLIQDLNYTFIHPNPKYF